MKNCLRRGEYPARPLPSIRLLHSYVEIPICGLETIDRVGAKRPIRTGPVNRHLKTGPFGVFMTIRARTQHEHREQPDLRRVPGDPRPGRRQGRQGRHRRERSPVRRPPSMAAISVLARACRATGVPPPDQVASSSPGVVARRRAERLAPALATATVAIASRSVVWRTWPSRMKPTNAAIAGSRLISTPNVAAGRRRSAAI